MLNDYIANVIQNLSLIIIQFLYIKSYDITHIVPEIWTIMRYRSSIILLAGLSADIQLVYTGNWISVNDKYVFLITNADDTSCKYRYVAEYHIFPLIDWSRCRYASTTY